MSRAQHLGLLGVAVLCLAAWIWFGTQDAPTASPDSSPFPDPVSVDREAEAHAQKTQADIAELARKDADRRQRLEAAEASEQARRMLQLQRNGQWSTVIQTNWEVYQSLRQAAVDSPRHSSHCTLCDHGGLMPFCILCDSSGECSACHGTGKSFGDRICPACLGKGKCYLCLGKGHMPCPFCDDGVIYTSLPIPSAAMPLVGAALSRPAAPKDPNSQVRPESTSPSQSNQVAASESLPASAPDSEPAPRSGFPVSQQLLLAVAFVLAGKVGLPRLCPLIGRFLNRQTNPWTASSTPAPAGALMAEDASFAELVALLRKDSPAVSPTPAVGVARAVETAEPAKPTEDIPKPDQLKRFFESAPVLLAEVRNLFAEINRVQNSPRQQKIFEELEQKVCAVKNLARLPELLPTSQLTTALLGLLKQLASKPANVTPSTLRTAGGAVAVLEALARPGTRPDLVTTPSPRFLVVDDDQVSRLAVALALRKALPQPDLAAGGEAALALVEKQTYDVIFLDVEMPGMDGYELCTRIHQSASNHTTPVIFITRHCDFDSRAKSTRSGGHDLIGKPFLSFEITVKALTFVLRNRLKLRHETSTFVKPDGVASTPEAAVPPGDFTGSFFTCAPSHLQFLRNELQAVRQSTDPEVREEKLGNIYVSVQSLAWEAERAELRSISRLSSTLQAFVKKLLETPDSVAPSNLDAIADTLDLLDELCVGELNPDLSSPALRVLVVDDDAIARRTISAAVQVALTQPDTAESGTETLALTAEKAFDLIFLDVQMPGMNGFATCSKIHETALNRHTPVVFITEHSDSNSRSQGAAAGGAGFIPKPALPSEITLRALTFAVRGGINRRPPNQVREKPEETQPCSV